MSENGLHVMLFGRTGRAGMRTPAAVATHVVGKVDGELCAWIEIVVTGCSHTLDQCFELTPGRGSERMDECNHADFKL